MLRVLAISLGIGLLYYLGAYLGVAYGGLPSGIAVLWPPNAVLLAALLRWPPRHWPLLAVAVLVAELAADYPAFTLLEALLFGLVNVAECTLAAFILQRVLARFGEVPDWEAPRDFGLFVVVVFFLASPLAAFAGAAVYTEIMGVEASYLSMWRIWWFGDATGLIVLTPVLHMLLSPGRYLFRGWRAIDVWEWSILTLVAILSCYGVFSAGLLDSQEYLALTPLLVLLAPFWIAVRLGALPAASLSSVVALYAAIATAAGLGPFQNPSPERTALLAQEFIILFVVVVLFAGAFVQQNRQKSHRLRLYKSAMEATSEGVLITEAGDDQPLIQCNPGFERMTGYSAAEALGRNCRFLNRPEPDQPALREIRQAIRAQQPVRVTLRNYRKDGEAFWNNLVINPIRDERGQVTHFVGVMSDITHDIEQQRRLETVLGEFRHINEHLEEEIQVRTRDLEEANRQLQSQATTDELTGLFNRRHLIELGETEWQRCQRSRHSFAVLLLDIDHFKRINDLHGHDAGDRALQSLAREVSSVLRQVDWFGRWGGEEFLLIVPQSDTVDLNVLGEKILETVAAIRVPFRGKVLDFTASIGIAVWQGGTFDELISCADKALYQAKSEGRNRLVFYQPPNTTAMPEKTV
ncbi:diguanylate cyclase [Marinobacteraceae bacterium S3BR75-40.1]